MKITFLGHATLEIKINEYSIIVDPFISGNPMASEINLDDLKPDFILITHAHQDHTLDVEKLAKQNDSVIVSNFEIVNHFQNKGLKGHPMNHGGKWDFDFGEVKYVNAIHTSTFPDGSNGGQPGGFIISANKLLIQNEIKIIKLKNFFILYSLNLFYFWKIMTKKILNSLFECHG